MFGIRAAIPATSRLNVIKYTNLASLLQTNELLGNYRNLFWFGSPIGLPLVEWTAAVLYAICMLLDCVTGTALAVKEKTWNSSKARKGLWHKGGSTIMICVSVLTDIFLGLVINHVLGLQLPFDYDMLLTPVVLTWYIATELGSILENAAEMGAPVPPVLREVLEKVHKASDRKDTTASAGHQDE